jgi:DNA-directed RNA polymerase subunit L
MNLRLQTLSQDTNDVLNDSLRTIQNVTKTLREKFQAAIKSCPKA